MSEEPTTVVVQRYLDALAGDAPAEPIVRELLERAAYRLERLCATHAAPELPASDRAADESGDGGNARRRGGGAAQGHASIRPRTVREFFALANQHMRWQLNDLARRLDEQPAAVELREGLVPAPASSESGITPDGRRILEAIDNLPEDEREVFGLVRIQGLTQGEAAGLLNVSQKTVQRRLNRGLLLLSRRLDDLRPDGETPCP